MDSILEVFKALSDKNRYNLLKLLLKHDLCVRALSFRLNISESAISQHLKILREAGVAKGDKRGYYTHYYINRKVLEEVAKHILELSQINSIEDELSQKMSKNHLNYGRSRGEIKKNNCQHPELRPKNKKWSQ